MLHRRRQSARNPVLVAAAALIALAPAGARAQEASGRAAPVRTAVFSIQPVSSIVGLYAAEFERRISESATVGVGAAAWLDEYSNDDIYSEDAAPRDRYLSAELKLRYYPGGEPLRGFSFGITGGVARLTNDVYLGGTAGGSSQYEQETRTAGKIGFELDYNWLLGRDRRFAVALGAGAKRLIMNDSDRFFDYSDFLVARAYPTARLSVGIAF